VLRVTNACGFSNDSGIERGWGTGNALNAHSGDTRFERRQRYRQPWLMFFALLFSSGGRSQASTSTSTDWFQLITHLSSFYHSTLYNLHTDSRIRGSHSGHYILGHNAGHLHIATTFFFTMVSCLTGRNFCLLHACFLLGLFFGPEDGGDMFLRNVDWFSTAYTALHSRTYNSP
jgi:hypothetical protein